LTVIHFVSVEVLAVGLSKYNTLIKRVIGVQLFFINTVTIKS
jgi:hypothetical protein